MAQVTIRINGFVYTVGCEDGQEAHLQAMATQVESRVESIKAIGNQSGESRLLLLAALLMADELHDLRAELTDTQRIAPGRGGKASPRLAQSINRLAERAEQIAADRDRP